MKFEFQTTFSSRVKTITPVEYCEQLSLASIKDLKKLFPTDFDVEGNPDVLLNAFNAAVANRINANDDGIGTDSALAISNKFLHKQCNIEHDRSNIVGHIISQGFTTFGGNEIVASESLASSNTPFNIALGAVVYKVANSDFADLLVEASDETSPRFGYVSASWELGFNKYNILLGHRDVAEGELITDEKQIKEFSKMLRAYGGTGKTKDGVPVYRLIVGGLPLGIGYTTSPAADVKGVIVKEEEEPEESEASKEPEREQIELNTPTEPEPETEVAATNEKSAETFSQTQTPPVKEYSIMDIKSLSDITDDLLKNVSAASVIDFIKSEIEKSNEVYKKQVAEKSDEASTTASKIAELEQKLSQATEALTKTNEQLAKVSEAQAKEVADRAFNERMATLNEQFDLDDATSAVIASEINGLSDEQYEAWFKKFEVLASGKKKQPKQEEQTKTEESTASTTTQSGTTTAENVLDNAKPEPTKTTLPNAGAVTEPTTFQKFQDAFSGDAIKITRR